MEYETTLHYLGFETTVSVQVDDEGELSRYKDSEDDAAAEILSLVSESITGNGNRIRFSPEEGE